MAKTMIIDDYDDGDLEDKEGGSSQRRMLAVRTGAVIRSKPEAWEELSQGAVLSPCTEGR